MIRKSASARTSTPRIAEDAIEQTRKSEEALERLAEEKARVTGLSLEQVQHQILAEAKTGP